ncbi:MAG: thioredoxin family protein [Bryobacteraceae bacterium]|jgi:peroxiredoxin
MKQTSGTVAGLTIAIAFLASATLVYGGKYNSTINIGMQAPVFTNLPATDGKSYSMSDFKEDVLVIVFLANHCPWVKGGEPDMIKTVGEYKSKSVRFVGIAINLRQEDTLPAMKARVQQAGYNFLYLFDGSQEIGRKYGATHTPEYFVLDKNRRVVYTGLLTNSPALMEGRAPRYTNGPPAQFYVRDGIEAAAAGKLPAVTETRPQGCTLEYASR